MVIWRKPDVLKLKQKRDVKGLIKALNYKKDKYIRVSAARALGDLKDPRAIESLSKAIHESDLRHTVAIALGRIGHIDAIKPLASALKYSDSGQWVTQALSCYKYKDVIEALQCKDDDASALALLMITKCDDIDSLRIIHKIIETGEKEARILAIRAAAKSKNIIFIKPLLNALKDRSYHICEEAALALREIGSGHVIDEVIGWLEIKNRSVSKTAIRALASLKNRKAIPPLLRLLNISDNNSKIAIIKALGALKAEQAIPELIKYQYDSNERVRKEAALNLKHLEWKSDEFKAPARADKPTLDTLVKRLKSGKKPIRNAKALCELNKPEIIIPLLEELDKNPNKELEMVIAGTFALLGRVGHTDELSDALTKFSTNVQKFLVGILDRCSWTPPQNKKGAIYWIIKEEFNRCAKIGEDAIEPLLDALKSPKRRIRKGASFALSQIDSQRALIESKKTYKEKELIGNFSLVKDQYANVIGLWFLNHDDVKDMHNIATVMTMKGLPENSIETVLIGNYRVVENNYDSKGGYFVMLGDFPAPGEGGVMDSSDRSKGSRRQPTDSEVTQAAEELMKRFSAYRDIKIASTVIRKEADYYLVECWNCKSSLRIPNVGLKRDKEVEAKRWLLANPVKCKCGQETEAIYERD